jgi:NIMA (never in mitosis gene a)-related kinase
MENFQLGDRIGSGAFGSVYKVIRKEDSKIYAMKRVKITQLGTKEKENALNEIRILASFNHPNIIGYKEAFYDDNSQTLNIVMEYADDGDIESKISNNKLNKLSFQESTIWNILIQILQGLKFLHDNNIIHRDLKSANIFLMKNGLIKIGDLNVSKLSNGMARTQTGTPYYAAPEIWVDKPYDNKVDIWSIGCIIYEMCALVPPFRGTSLVNLANNIRKGIYPPIPKIYSKDLSNIIAKMLIVDSRNRPSCQQLINNPIIQNRIVRDSEIYAENNEKKADLIKTIILPSKVKDINRILPHNKKPKVKREEEMMKNDEYETMKATMFKQVSQENKKNDNVKLFNKDNNESKQRNQIETPKIKKEDDKKVVISNNNNQKKNLQVQEIQ